MNVRGIMYLIEVFFIIGAHFQPHRRSEKCEISQNEVFRFGEFSQHLVDLAGMQHEEGFKEYRMFGLRYYVAHFILEAFVLKILFK